MLHIVPSIERPADPKAEVNRMRRPANVLQCPRCGGREVTPTIIGAMLAGGKVTGGTK